MLRQGQQDLSIHPDVVIDSRIFSVAHMGKPCLPQLRKFHISAC